MDAIVTSAELWLPIPGFPGYEVSDFGRVRTFYRPNYKPKVMTPVMAGIGYRKVTLRRNGVACQRYVHRLVLETFVGPCPPEMESCHGDGNRANNRLGNLRWGTHSDNVQDQVRHGTHIPNPLLGEDSPWAKLTADDVRVIRRRVESGESNRTVAADYGLTRTAIYCIKTRRAWKHIA